ncbi:unnamed protein product [Sphagnum balticum]
MGVGVAALVFFWVGLLLAVVVPCMFAGGGAVVVADSEEEWSASSSRLEYGLKTEESGRMQMSDLFEKWVGSGGVVVAAGEKNKKLLDDDDSTRQKKVKSRVHVDDLKEELGGDSSWAAAAAAGGTFAAAQSWVQQQQQHTKEDGDDQSYQQSGLSVQERDELKILGSSSSLRGDLMKLFNGTEVQLFPSVEVVHHKHVNETRRRLGNFQQCSPCTCCDRTHSWCIPLVCCYNIQCNLEGLPFGLCSFIPISCSCFGCSS